MQRLFEWTGGWPSLGDGCGSAGGGGNGLPAETGPAAATDHDTVVDYEHNPNALQLALFKEYNLR